MRRWGVLLVTLCLTGLHRAAAGADVQEASVAAERVRIQSERRQLQSHFARDEAACYQRFAVNDCLIALRAKRREALSDLRRQEVSLNDVERKSRGAAQVQRVQDKVASGSDAALLSPPARVESRSGRNTTGRAGPTTPALRPPAKANPPPKRTAKVQKAPSASAEAVARYEQKQREAAERRAKRDAKPAVGKKPASPPLPAAT